LRRYRRGPDSPKRNHSFDTNVTASISHRTFHKQYHERDRKRQHGHHPKAVEISKRRRLLLTQVLEFLPSEFLGRDRIGGLLKKECPCVP